MPKTSTAPLTLIQPAVAPAASSPAATARSFYDSFFDLRLQELHREGRYRVFANLERQVGRFPKAVMRMADGVEKDDTLCFSNDYLGLGPRQSVIDAMCDTA